MNDKVNMHGLVKIYDENHKLIQEKNNMIVEEGRKKILKVLFASNEELPKLKYFYEIGGIETVLTSPDMTYQSIVQRCTENGIGKLEKISDAKYISIEWKNKRGIYLIEDTNDDKSTFYSDDIIVYEEDSNKNKIRMYEYGKGFTLTIKVGKKEITKDCTNNVQRFEFNSENIGGQTAKEATITVKLNNLSNQIIAQFGDSTSVIGPHKETTASGDLKYEIFKDNAFSYEILEDKIKTVYSARIIWNDSFPSYEPLSAVGLFWTDVDGTNHLFSRAAIDPIYMNPNRTYIVEHTIYL